jgi:hypothetical protein
LSEFLSTQISPQCITDSCLILESTFSDICNSIRINHEEAFLDQFPKSDLGIVLPCNHGEKWSLADETPGRTYPSYVQEVSAQDDDLNWFFEDDDDGLTGSTAKSIGYHNEDTSVRGLRAESNTHCSNLSSSLFRDSGSIRRPGSADSADCADSAVNAETSTGPGIGIRTFCGTNACDEDVKNATDTPHTISEPDILSDAWLAYGLQHSFKWEFEFNTAENIDINCGTQNESSVDCPQCKEYCSLDPSTLCRHDVSLPMRLAMIAADSLWGGEKSGGKCDYCASQNAESGSRRAVKESLLKQGVCSSSCTVDNSAYSQSSCSHSDCAGNGVTDRDSDPHHYSSSVPHTAVGDISGPSSDSSARNTYTIRKSAKSFANERGEGRGYDYYSFLDELSLDDLTVHTVTGVPTAYSDVRPGSLLSSCKKDIVSKSYEIAFAKQEKEKGKEKDFARTVRTSTDRDAPLVLQRVAVIDTGWDTDCFDSGNMGEGTGASIQARTLSHVFVRTMVSNKDTYHDAMASRNRSDAGEVWDGDRDRDENGNEDVGVEVTMADRVGYETSDSLYLRDSMALLQSLKVDAIFCPLAFCSLKLLDACLSASIAVFPLSTRDLNTVAYLSSAEIVRDLMDLDRDAVGRALGVRLLPFLSVRANDSVSGSRAEREEDAVLVEFCRALGDSRGGVSIREGKRCESDLRAGEERRNNADSDDNQVSDKFRDINLCCHLSDHPSSCPSNPDPCTGPDSDSNCNADCDTHSPSGAAPGRVASVVIASPTSAQTAALADRFFRCLHRLRGVIQGAGVMPGGGETTPE